MKVREYRDYIQDMLDSISDIEMFIGDMTEVDFLNDKKTYNAVIRSIEIIGEASKNLPEEIKSRDINIPWKKIAGMRDKLIHAYFGVDNEILWKTIKEDIPPLKPLIFKLLD